MNRDVIAIGASSGGVEVLLDLARALPENLQASVFVVIHVSADHTSTLPELLSECGPLPAKHPLHGEEIRPGHIYVAPPDNHLLVRQGSMEVVRGPKENGHRPAVDSLFRSASVAYGPRVVGVVLSGYHDCGTAGMMSIKARGGVCVVQAPETVRALEESAALSRRLSATQPGDLRRRFAEKASTQAQQADLIRQILLYGASLSVADPVKG
jgi:two-component system chemotaxis response regulator CheB